MDSPKSKILPQPPQDSITGLRFIPEASEYLAASSWDGFVRVYNVDKRQLVYISEAHHPVLACATTRSAVYYGGMDCVVHSLDLRTQLCRKIGEHKDTVRSIEYSESLRLVLTGSWDASVMLWDERSLACVGNIPQASKVLCMDVRDDLVVVGCEKSMISLWDLRNTKTFTGERKANLSGRQIRSIKMFPDKKKFAVGCVKGRIAIESVHEDKASSYSFRAHVEKGKGVEAGKDIGHPVNAISIHSQTSLFVTGAADRRARVWDTDRKSINKELSPFPGSIAAMDFSPDGFELAIGCSYTPNLVSTPDPMPATSIYVVAALFPAKTNPEPRVEWWKKA